MPPHDGMLKFEPQWYFRLIKRRSNVIHNHVEYDLTQNGIEDPRPTVTIIPMMATFELVMGEQTQVFYISYLDKVYKGTIVTNLLNGDVTIRVPLDASPVVTYEVPTSRTAPAHTDPAATTRPRPADG